MPTSKQIYSALKNQQPMKMWTTEIWAYDPRLAGTTWGSSVCCWQGPHVPGTSLEDAQRYCDTHNLGYCRVTGEVKNN